MLGNGGNEAVRKEMNSRGVFADKDYYERG